MSKIVITEFMDESAITACLNGHEVIYDPTLVDKRDALLAALPGVQALIVRNRTQVDEAVLAAAPALKVVGRLGVGLDNINVEACRKRGIAVYPATGANDLGVAEYVIATAMMLMRGAYLATGEVIAGRWPRQRLMGHEIAGKKLGLVGFGSIARLVAGKAAALGMTIAAHDPFLAPDDAAWTQPWGKAERLGLEQLLQGSDVVSLHVPFTDKTRNLLDRAAIAHMKKSAILINTARGGVVDEEAMADALRVGRLGGAAIDVFTQEPLSEQRGQIFAGCPNLVLTPHIAGVSIESNVRVSHVTAENVRRHLAGA
jgi:(S)-sulfolactate dehydrogenase